jgi:iron complex transport system substrate-binding protein
MSAKNGTGMIRILLWIGVWMQVPILSAAAAAPRYARNFSLDSTGGVQRLRFFAGKDTAVYALCPEGHGPAHVAARMKILSTPLRRVICLGSVHAGFLEALDLRDRIVGVDRGEIICDPALRAAGKSGAWSAAGSDAQVDWERVVSLHPDAIIYSFPPGGTSPLESKARALRIPALAMTEWLENHPLGRAEWLRVYGVLFGRERKADSLFEVVRSGYDSLRASAQARQQRPTAIAGLGWRGRWFVAGGASYAARFLRDAGIRYLWEEDDHTGSLTLGLESVLEKGRNADLWLSPGEAHSLDDLTGMEPRASRFRAFREGRVYQHDARDCPDGGNLYWESGVTRPDLLLSDLTRLAEGKLDQHSGNYYRRLPESNSPKASGRP